MKRFMMMLTAALLTLSLPLSAQFFVREGADISDAEKNVLERRLPIIRGSLENLLEYSLKDSHVPGIGIILSGGGCRSAIASHAFIQQLEEQGILAACSHIAALSGSTWMLSSWLAHNVSLGEIKKYLREVLADPVQWCDISQMAMYLWNKSVTDGQAINITDAYGLILGDIFLKTVKQKKLSDLAATTHNGDFPFPIFTAMINDAKPRECMEFNPYEIGSLDYLKAWIPCPDFGKAYDNGQSSDLSQELPLHLLLGIFGSAYAFGPSDLLKWVTNEIKRKGYSFSAPSENSYYQRHATFLYKLNSIKSKAEKDSSGHITESINNFTQGLDGSPLKDIEEVTLIDAGIECNLPFAPILARKEISCYLVCDVSAWGNDDVMREVQEYAQRKGYLLPEFDYEKIKNHEACLFYDPKNPNVPVIIYIPLQAEESSMQFKYSNEEFDHLHDSMTNLVKNSTPLILDGIEHAIQNQKERRSKCVLF